MIRSAASFGSVAESRHDFPRTFAKGLSHEVKINVQRKEKK